MLFVEKFAGDVDASNAIASEINFELELHGTELVISEGALTTQLTREIKAELRHLSCGVIFGQQAVAVGIGVYSVIAGDGEGQ